MADYTNFSDPEEQITQQEEEKIHGRKGYGRLVVKLLLAFGLLVVIGAVAGIVIHFAMGSPPDESPRELFVSAGHNGSTAVNISWVTESDSVASCAHIGASSDSLDTKYCDGKKSSYTFNSYKFGLYTSPTIHVVTVDGLAPSTTYFYSVGDFDRGKTSDVFSFRTAPPPLHPTAFTVVGDLGQTSNSKMTLQRMAMHKEADAILHVGDMSYADTKQSRWHSWFDMVQGLSTRKQWMVLPGNHEIESQTGTGLSFVPYQSRFHMPAVAPPVNLPIPAQADCKWWSPGLPYPNGPGCCTSVLVNNTFDYGNAFYAFDVGSVRVLSLNSYTDSSKTSVQYQWVEKELQLASARADHPWVVVMMHCPFYNSNTHHQNEQQALNMKASMEGLFLQYGVTLVLAGHVHAYERTHRIAYGDRSPTGIYYVTMGDGGNREGHAKPFEDPQPDWSDKRNSTLYGHSRISVANATHMHWQWFPTRDTGELVAADDKWITREI